MQHQRTGCSGRRAVGSALVFFTSLVAFAGTGAARPTAAFAQFFLPEALAAAETGASTMTTELILSAILSSPGAEQAPAARPQGKDHPHRVLNFSCESCHVPATFQEIHFDHTQTKFELEGRHQNVNCLSCHDVENFAEVETNCVACHQDVHQAKLGNNCQRCHSPESWTRFDAEEIHIATRFPLLGRHALVDCQSCHPGSPHTDFAISATTCETCHQQQYLDATSVEHVSLGFSTDCQMCHQMNDWTPAIMPDHDALFFPIFSGEHNRKWDACSACHANSSNFSDFSCLTCHTHNQQKMDDKHRGMSGYAYSSPNCLTCHPSGGGGDFRDHDSQFFPIFSGKHKNTWEDCVTCHVDPGSRKVFSCFTCHEHAQPETDSKHSGISGYSYDSNNCLLCHPSGEGGDFRDHDAQFFPIFSGKHNNKWSDCAICHTDPSNRKVFSCLTCHEHRQSKMDDEHRGISGYVYNSNNCLQCHPGGKSEDFTQHDSQFFPIFSGQHNNTWEACATCHTNPGLRKEYTCVSCHEHDQTIMDPQHAGIPGYVFDSSNCLLCHPTGEGGDFHDHDGQYFPIYSGKHNNQWSDCATCHTQPNNRKAFSCVTCHEHAQSVMDPKHSGITGYVFDSSNCLLCHPTGEGGDFRNHDPQYFPIFSGKHNGKWNDCAICHTDPNNRKVFSCVTCHEHAQSAMDPKHSGIPGYVFNSANCLQCHPTGDKGQFTQHDNLYFPIYSGAHRGKWDSCAKCHTVPTNSKIFSCLDCHEHNQAKMDDKHLGEVANYRYDSNACYDCHPNGKGD